jgi:hypothetical protein
VRADNNETLDLLCAHRPPAQAAEAAKAAPDPDRNLVEKLGRRRHGDGAVGKEHPQAVEHKRFARLQKTTAAMV